MFNWKYARKLRRLLLKERGQPEVVTEPSEPVLVDVNEFMRERTESYKKQKEHEKDMYALFDMKRLNHMRKRKVEIREQIYNILTDRQKPLEYKMKKSTREELALIISKEVR